MRRLTTTLALGIWLVGCGLVAPVPVPLLTGVSGCYLGGESGTAGVLLVDPEYGTSLNGKPVMWPVGFTAARVGREVEVRDAEGHAVARTGRAYYISVGPVDAEEKRQLKESIGAFPAAANCGYPWDFVDCESPPTGSPGMAVAEQSCGDL